MAKSKKALYQDAENALVEQPGRAVFSTLLPAGDLLSLGRGFVSVDAHSGIESAHQVPVGLTQLHLKELISRARFAAEKSYSPYSKFRVGAAVLAGDRLYTGCNVENASYGLTVCAERVAIFTAIADGNRNIRAIAISCLDAALAGSLYQKMPCGACRQVIEEFLTDNGVILIDNVGCFKKGNLLPAPFKLRQTGL